MHKSKQKKGSEFKNACLFFLIFLAFFSLFPGKSETATFKKDPTLKYSIVTLGTPNEEGNITNFWVEGIVKDTSGKSKLLWLIVCDQNGYPQYCMDGNKNIKTRYRLEKDDEDNIKGMTVLEVEKDSEGNEKTTKSWKYDSEGNLKYWVDAEGRKIKPVEKRPSYFEEPLTIEFLSKGQSLTQMLSTLKNTGEATADKDESNLQPRRVESQKDPLLKNRRYPFPRFMLGQTGFVIYVAVFALFAGAVVGFIVYTFHSSK